MTATKQPDPFDVLYAANRHPDDPSKVDTRDGVAVLCWLGDDGVLRIAKTTSEPEPKEQPE